MANKKFLLRTLCIFTLFFAVSITLFAQDNVIDIDANGRTIDEMVGEILLDWRDYNGRHLSIKNVTFRSFGTDSGGRVAYAPDETRWTNWFQNAETYTLEENPVSERRRSMRFMFWFQPAEREGRRLMLDLDGRRYQAPKRLTLNGYFFRTQEGPITYNPFIVTSFELDGNVYRGIVPANLR